MEVDHTLSFCAWLLGRRPWGGALGVWACVAVVEVGEPGRFRICLQGEASRITDGLDGMPERGHPEGWGGWSLVRAPEPRCR